MTRLIIISLSIFLLSFSLAWAQPVTQRLPPIDAIQLWQVFQEDSGKERFVGKIATVHGIVVGRDISQYLTAYIVLSESREGPARVLCVLPRSDALALTEFELGQRVTVAGTVYGYSAEKDAVVLKRCIVVE